MPVLIKRRGKFQTETLPSTGLTNAEFKRFHVIANRSALEVVGCLYLAKRRAYISDEKFNELYARIETLVKMIQALINSLTTNTVVC